LISNEQRAHDIALKMLELAFTQQGLDAFSEIIKNHEHKETIPADIYLQAYKNAFRYLNEHNVQIPPPKIRA
jgi:hypothetical protein